MNDIRTGIMLILLGFALLFAGMVLSGGRAEGGVLVMIGPIPLAAGTSPEMTIVAMALGLFIMLVYLFMWRRRS
ncbi:MAG TPA: DUF131 domain-containing protein [Candidatus Methanoperedenaceae archaeon]|nr:DUF131 domain-containing protein [Candidatus Methanoperedenaceae archaeon]